MAESGVDAVVFDLGGVLIDWNPRYLYRRLFADEKAMDEFLATICTDEWHRGHDLGVDIGASCRELAAVHPQHQDMIMAWAERGEEMAAGQLDEGVEVLRELKAAGVRCYALSNMEPGAFARRRRRFAFMSWFDGHVISGLEGVSKPDRRIFDILLQRYQLEPGDCVLIDDSLRNVRGAREVGMIGLHYTSAAQLRADLGELGLLGLLGLLGFGAEASEEHDGGVELVLQAQLAEGGHSPCLGPAAGHGSLAARPTRYRG